MCTYNGETFLSEQLDSIIAQTIRPNEIIIYDDASTDNTVEIIKKYQRIHSDINWLLRVNQKNLGWRVNFKNCISEATGDIVFLADQDDIWKEDKLEILSTTLENYPQIKLLVSDYQPFYMEGAVEHHLNTHCKNTKKVIEIKPNERFIYCDRPGCTFAFKRELIEDFMLCWHDSFAHDALLWQIACLKNQLYRIDYSSILFRRHSSNASSNKNKRISAAERKLQQSILYMYRDCVEKLQTLSLSKQSAAVLAKVSKWNEKRIALYEKPSIWKWIALCVKIGHYRSIKSYLKDLNAILYKNKE